MRTSVKMLPVLAAAVLVAGFSTPAWADQKDEKIAALEARVEALEAELALIKSQLGPVVEKLKLDAARDHWRARAQQRMRKDLDTQERTALAQLEQLYQKANRNLSGGEARPILEQIIAQYPGCNRTGCAVLYLAQMSTGEEHEQLLIKARDQFGDCFYGDGVQVGPYAMYHLAWYYRQTDQPDKAAAMVDAIRAEHATAITHKGGWLVDALPE